MKLEMDTIQFEDREEVQDIIHAIEEYCRLDPEAKGNISLRRLYDLLDVLEMSW